MNIKSQKGFTLIELLVVIAIIGILASVVLASLNSARTKGTIAAIKSNLKNMIPQAELAYDVPGNYSAVCADTKVASMLTAITNAGGTAKCYSNNNSTYGDVYLRWGASSHLNSDSTQNFSVDPMGVVTWDTIYSPDTTMTWDNANIFCASKNGHLPSLEELKALYDSYDDGTGTHPTPSFSSIYWTSTIVPSFPSNANYVNMSTGVVGYPLKSALLYVRCVH